ncbi:MAG: hypothetical protein AABW86_05780 [Candidatus Micrarchaeota archaeon]
MYQLEYDQDWYGYFDTVPEDIQRRFMKRREKYIAFPTFAFRHEKREVTFFVDEIGQYRALFTSDETTLTRKFYFIGDHKAYEKFIGIRK